jgi:hypothetical protein
MPARWNMPTRLHHNSVNYLYPGRIRFL